MKAIVFSLLIIAFQVKLDADPPSQYPPAEGRNSVITKEPNGDVSTYTSPIGSRAGMSEVKEVDKNGNILQWYQSFLDSEGHAILSLDRKSLGSGSSYGGIEDIWVRTYNAGENVVDEYNYLGDGTFRSHGINIYDATGKWIRLDFYDATGRFLGSGSHPNVAYLYGEKKAKQKLETETSGAPTKTNDATTAGRKPTQQ